MDKKIQNNSQFLEKINQLHKAVSTTEKKKYEEIKKVYCQNGKEGLYKMFENKKIRQIAIQEASQEGDVQILKKWQQYHKMKQNSECYLKKDIQKGWVQQIIINEDLKSLEWWYINKRDILLDCYVSDILTEACKQGKLYVLDWCKGKNDIQWEIQLLENLPNNKVLKILDWWYENKEWTQLIYRTQLLDKLCQYCEIDQLQWFYDMRNEIGPLKYTTQAIENACKYGNISVLNWWYYMNDTLEMKYDKKAIEQACENGQFRVIQWWADRPALDLKYDEKNLSIEQYLNVLKQNKYKKSQQEEEICQICHETLKNKQVFECYKCKKQLDEDCYQELKTKNKKLGIGAEAPGLCPNCQTILFI